MRSFRPASFSGAALVIAGLLVATSTPASAQPAELSAGQSGTATLSTEVPAVAPTLPTGITGWKTYTSDIYGFTVGYPEDWSVHTPATREWQADDSLDLEDWPYADTFVSPGPDEIGVWVWEMPAGPGAEGEGQTGVASLEGLMAWANGFCAEVLVPPCGAFTQLAEPMCLNAGGDPCRAAILVPTADEQYAFFVDWSSAMFTNIPDRVRVVIVGREDSFPSASSYGGSVALLRAILTTMDVWTPGLEPTM